FADVAKSETPQTPMCAHERKQAVGLHQVFAQDSQGPWILGFLLHISNDVRLLVLPNPSREALIDWEFSPRLDIPVSNSLEQIESHYVVSWLMEDNVEKIKTNDLSQMMRQLTEQVGLIPSGGNGT